MQQVHYVIADCGDGSQTLEWYKGSQFSADQICEAIENCKGYESERYQSGDGIQINTIEFPDDLNLDHIGGLYWYDYLPGQEVEAEE